MRTIAVVLALAIGTAAQAGKLDLDPLDSRPLPSIAAADSAILPGAGWYYTAANGGGARDFWIGTAYLGAVVGGALVAANLIRDRNHSANQYLGGVLAGGLLCVRFGDVHGASHRAVELSVGAKR